MQIPMLSNIMTPNQWFDLVAQGGQGEKTYIYEVTDSSPAVFKGGSDDSEVRYVRTSLKNAEELRATASKVRKLSFSEIVHISDYFVARFIPSFPSIEAIVIEANQGKSFDIFENLETNLSSYLSFKVTLKTMNKEVRAKYFDKGCFGVVRSFFSAIANFFRKYDLYIKTGIYWPGNSCSWADKVDKQINCVKIILEIASEASKLKVGEYCKDIPSEELDRMKSEDVKKLRKVVALKLHPDKHLEDQKNFHEQFKEVYSVMQDYEKLLKLHEKLFGAEEQQELKEELNHSPLNEKKYHPLAFRVVPLALTAN